MSEKVFGLKKSDFGKSREWMMDQDYVIKLAPQEREWLAKFNNEYYGGNVTKANMHESLHNTESLRKEVVKRANDARNDPFMRVSEFQDLVSGMVSPDFADALIESIDQPEGSKRCSQCAAIKPSHEFSLDSFKKCGFRSYCKICQSSLARDYYRKKVRLKSH